MSTLTSSPPGLDKARKYWVDVEVPYTKIVEKWDWKYKPRLHQHMENGRLQKRVLSIYFKSMGKTDFAHNREDALDELIEHDREWAVNLCCQFEFSTGISEETIVEFAKTARSDIVAIGLEEEYEKNMGQDDSSPNKDGLVALCQLANPDLLRQMLVYSRVSSRYPKTVFKRDSGSVPASDNWGQLIKTLSENSVEDYDVWYQFEHEGGRYIAIEQEDRDGVERQVGTNIEEEPANLILLHFDGQYLDVYTDTRKSANLSQTGVNKDVSGDNYEEDRNTVSSDEIGDFASDITEKDRERQEADLDLDYVLTDLHVSRTPLPNNPELTLSSESGVGKAVNELDYDLLSDPKNIERLKIRFEGYKFIVTNTKRRTGSGDVYRELVYGCHAGTDTREEFEDLMEKEFGISIKYQSSS